METGIHLPENMTEQIAKGLMYCADENWWHNYAELLASMKKLGMIDFNDPTYQAISEHIRSLPSEDQLFAQEYISFTLETNGSLSDFYKKNGPYAVFQSLRDTSIALNDEEIEETKKVRDAEVWWQEHQGFFGAMLSLRSSIAEGFLKETIANGLPAVNGKISVYKKALSNPEARFLVQEALRQGQIQSGHELGVFLETASAFVSYNKIDDLRNIVKEESSEPLFQRAGSKLLSSIAYDLGIDEREVKEWDVTKWNLEYMPNLVSNDVIMQKYIEGGDEGMENARELYRAIMKATFEG